MLNTIVDLCHQRYQIRACSSCSYHKYCRHNCAKCLHYIHSPQDAPAPRKYDCAKMMDYYVCKYAHKYTSEMSYALKSLRTASHKKHLRILSIGCGPCTDLFALNMLQQKEEYHFSTLEYHGIEINTAIWSDILCDIDSLSPPEYNVSIVNANACDHIESLFDDEWRPDLIVLQYVFSDMQKNCRPEDIDRFLKTLGKYIDSCNNGTYIICNDINLSTKFDGGREYFDSLLNHISSATKYSQRHFYNSNKQNHYQYGQEYPSNVLLYYPPEHLDFYEPYTTCASAQILIKKV